MIKKILILIQDIPDFTNTILLPTVLSSAVLITLFVLGRFLDSLVERKRNSQEWYMKMVLEPHNDLIHDYFQKSIDQAKTFSKELQLSNSLEKKSLLFEVLANDKRRIEFNFILLVSKPYPKTANNLTLFVNDLYDKSVTYLDNEDYSQHRFEILEKEIMTVKGDFFQEIYNPFRIKSISKWFKKNYLLTLVIILFIFFMYIIGTNLSKNKEFIETPPVYDESKIELKQG